MASPSLALGWLKENQDYFSAECDYAAAYSVIFEHYYTSGKLQREIIQTAIAEADDKINWAHICLGQLVDRHYVHTVLTTNFDQLVSRGIIFTGRLPVIADGVESMDRLDAVPRFPQVVHLHGSMHTYRPRNGSSAVRDTQEVAAMHGTIWNTCRGADILIVVGYAGREEGVVDVLAEVVKSLPQTVIFWITYEPDDRALSSKVKEILSGPKTYVIYGQDADVFFAELMRLLDEPIDWMQNPLQTLFDRKIELSHANEWATELQRDNIDILRTLYIRRLEMMKEAGPLAPQEETIWKAAAASQSGNDEQVIELLGALDAVQDDRVAPLLALSLLRTGDRLRDEAMILRSIELTREHISAAPDDFSARLLLGDAYSALADLFDGRPERVDDVVTNREMAVSAYQEAIDRTPPDNHKGRRLAVEKFAVAVSESGREGGATETIDAAIGALDGLLEDRNSELSWPERAEFLDRVAMLRLMRGTRSSQRTDFLDALRASDEALKLIGNDLSTMTAIGMLRNNASVHRSLGAHTVKFGSVDEGRRELNRAAELYLHAGEAYLKGVIDADPADYRYAAGEAFDLAQKVAGEIGADEIAQRVHVALVGLEK